MQKILLYTVFIPKDGVILPIFLKIRTWERIGPLVRFTAVVLGDVL